MDLQEAIKDLLTSEKFLNESKNNSNLRVYLKRFRENKLGNELAINLLKQFGYDVKIIVKKNKK